MDVVWFWPVSDRVKVHARLTPSPQSLCKRWMEAPGEDIEDYSPTDPDRPACKSCLTQVARLGQPRQPIALPRNL